MVRLLMSITCINVFICMYLQDLDLQMHSIEQGLQFVN